MIIDSSLVKQVQVQVWECVASSWAISKLSLGCELYEPLSLEHAGLMKFGYSF